MASGFFHCVSEIASLLELSLPTYPVFPSSSNFSTEENPKREDYFGITNLVEHPAQGVLADGQDTGVKPCDGKDMSQPALSCPAGFPAFCPKGCPRAHPLPRYILSSLLPEYAVVVGF